MAKEIRKWIAKNVLKLKVHEEKEVEKEKKLELGMNQILRHSAINTILVYYFNKYSNKTKNDGFRLTTKRFLELKGLLMMNIADDDRVKNIVKSQDEEFIWDFNNVYLEGYEK